MPLRAVFFDLDGTLLDTALDLSTALNNTLKEDGLPELPIQQARCIVSEGSFALIKRGYNLNDNAPEIPALRQRLLNHYANTLSRYTKPFDGVETLISNIAQHGLAWGIITNKPWAYTEPLMQRFTFASKPSCILSPEHVQNSKPHPESLFLACEQTGCAINEAMYIGDHKRDIDCGINAGMPTIAVSYGYIAEGDSAYNWHADHCVDTVQELWPVLSGYLK